MGSLGLYLRIWWNVVLEILQCLTRKTISTKLKFKTLTYPLLNHGSNKAQNIVFVFNCVWKFRYWHPFFESNILQNIICYEELLKKNLIEICSAQFRLNNVHKNYLYKKKIINWKYFAQTISRSKYWNFLLFLFFYMNIMTLFLISVFFFENVWSKRK